MKVHSRKRNRARIGGLSVTVVSLLLLLGEPAYPKSVVLKNSAEDSSVIGKWMAVGSGCRSTSEDLGDVRLKKVEEKGVSETKAFHVEFELPDYELKPFQPSKKLESPSKVNYARECAIRLSIQPPKNMRLGSVSARAQAELTKDSESALLLQGALKVGAATLATHQRRFGKGEEFRKREEHIDLFPGRSPEEQMPQSECGQGRVVGVDLTLLTNKASESSEVEGTLGKDKTVSMVIALESCS